MSNSCRILTLTFNKIYSTYYDMTYLFSAGFHLPFKQWHIRKICFCLPWQSCCCYNEDTSRTKKFNLRIIFVMILTVSYNQRNSKSSNKIFKQINLFLSSNFIGLYYLSFTVLLLPFLQNKHARHCCCLWNCTSLVGYLCNF